MQHISRQQGFTLIEVIATLLILGFMLAASTVGFSQVIQGFVQTQDHSDMVQEVQVAMTRIYYELQHIDSISASSDTAITYRPRFNFTDGVLPERTIQFNAGAGTITFDGAILIDNVTAFQLAYLEDSFIVSNSTSSFDDDETEVIEVTITVGGAILDGNRVQRTFVTRVQPTVLHFS